MSLRENIGDIILLYNFKILLKSINIRGMALINILEAIKTQNLEEVKQILVVNPPAIDTKDEEGILASFFVP